MTTTAPALTAGLAERAAHAARRSAYEARDEGLHQPGCAFGLPAMGS